MKRWHGAIAAIVLVVTACTQKLTTTADCPALCPGGQVVFRDTVLEAVVGLDSSYSGYSSPLDAVGLLASNGGDYGQTRAVVKFLRRGDSLLVKDTMRAFTVDSVVVRLTLLTRDPTVTNLALELYRLPRATDTLASFATVDAAMTPANLLGVLEVPDSVKSGHQQLSLSGVNLAKLAFAPEDSSDLVVGVKIRATGSAGVRLGSLIAGVEAPLFATYIRVAIADTTLQKKVVNRTPSQNLTVRPPEAGVAAGILPVGGFPASRAFVRFTLPSFFRDSARIVRATLQLTTAQPLFGIPGDTAYVEARAVLSDLGPKSPVASNAFGAVAIHRGQSIIAIELVPVVQLWQGSTPLPSIIRLGLAQEGSTFLAPLIRSTKALTGRPTVRLTYRSPFAFEGF